MQSVLGAALIKSLEYLLAKAKYSDAMNKQQPFIVDSRGQWFTEIALCLFNYHHHVCVWVHPVRYNTII